MKVADFNASIRAAIDFYADINLWRATVCNTALPRSEEFNKLNLTSRDYVAIYERGLALSHYNLLLTDLSYFQFSYKNEREFALAYYPNPRLSGSPEALEQYREMEEEWDEGRWTYEEFAELAALLPAQTFIPRIRFEYSEEQYKAVRHPGAHFHIGMSGEDRWASARKLSPNSFALLMAKFYHPNEWWSGSRFSKEEEEQHLYTDDCYDEKLLQSIKSDGASQYFSANERMYFHFAALVGAPA